MTILRTAYVYVRNVFAGQLCETGKNASAVSLTLPLSDEVYSSKTLFSFFDGLIPEGWLLDVVSRNWKLDNKDRFGLLLVACKDCIGNVTIMEEKL